MKKPKLENLGSLITYDDGGIKDRCLGYLMDFEGHGIYEPTFGRMDGITHEQATKHNQLLSEAQIKGLDENCQIGQGGMFYYSKSSGEVRTWTSDLVSKAVHVAGMVITFRRNGRTFRGRLRKDSDCFNFRRIA